MKQFTAVEHIRQRINLIRGRRVMLDSDLALVYGVTVKRLNEQVKRNHARFPNDFAFQLTLDETAILRSQNATLRSPHGKHRKYRPRAYTEHGAIMAATVLNSETAVRVSVLVVRAFVRMREVLEGNHDLAEKLDAFERRLAEHESTLGRHSTEISAAFETIRRLMEPQAEPKPSLAIEERRVPGFRARDAKP